MRNPYPTRDAMQAMQALQAALGTFGTYLIQNERMKQVYGKLPSGGTTLAANLRWTSQHDDTHSDGELLAAALCYQRAALTSINPNLADAAPEELARPPADWPWEPESWKPTWGGPIRMLQKAGALIAAEIDRLERKANPGADRPVMR